MPLIFQAGTLELCYACYIVLESNNGLKSSAIVTRRPRTSLMMFTGFPVHAAIESVGN